MAKDLAWVTAMAATLPKQLQAAQTKAVRASALHVTQAIRDEVRVATGGDMRLSGVGRRGARVGARFDVRGTKNPTAMVKATGPMHLLEHDTRPHEIGPRGRRVGRSGRRLKGAKALRIGGEFRASAQHPGTHAKRPFERGYIRSRDETGPIFNRAVEDAIRKAMR